MAEPLQPLQKKPHARNIIAFSALIMMMFCVVVAYQSARSYETAIVQGEAESERLIQSLASHVELTFLAIDLTLRRAIERNYFNSLFGNTISRDMEHNFRMWVKDTPQISALYLTDERGTIVLSASTGSFVDLFRVGNSVKQETFFSQAQEGMDSEQFVTLHTADTAAMDRSLIIARKFVGINGEFQGIVFAAMDPNYFNRYFRSIDTGISNFMAMLHQDGRILVTGTVDDAENESLTSALDKESKQDLGAKGIILRRATHGHIKLYSFYKMSRLPVILAVAMDEADFLASWRNDRRRDVGFLAMFAIFGSILSYFALTMIKQIKRVEKSEQAAITASQAKSEFLANMSHELRTPLNAVIGFSEMLDAGYFGTLAAKQKERVHDINMCGNHLLQLINEVLEFSKGEAGKMELSEEAFDIATVMDECKRILTQKARQKGVLVETKSAKGLPNFYGDKRKMRQLLLNLMTNAVKFTEAGGTITVQASKTASNKMQLIVSDTGIGMSESDIPVAMSVFGQVHRNSHQEGTGLGLPLCRMFTELHGGVLHIKSEPGTGTKVTLTFPTERLAPAQKTPSKPLAAPHKKDDDAHRDTTPKEQASENAPVPVFTPAKHKAVEPKDTESTDATAISPPANTPNTVDAATRFAAMVAKHSPAPADASSDVTTDIPDAASSGAESPDDATNSKTDTKTTSPTTSASKRTNPQKTLEDEIAELV